jgi:uncharacterized protein
VKIRVEELREKPLVIEACEPVKGYPELIALQEDGACRFLGPLDIWLQVAREYDHLRVEGKTSTSVMLGCARCLGEYHFPIEAEFTLFFRKSRGEPVDEEVELGEHDLVSLSYEGDEIDFAPCISEQIIMELPYKPLCKAECRGLCPVCGADLNSGDCGCNRQPLNLKFGALKDFTVKNKGE